MYNHPADYWIVVKGTSEVTCSDKVIFLTENQSTYIFLVDTSPENFGNIPLEIIEVQLGSYLGEHDIVWFKTLTGELSLKGNE